MVPEHNGAVSVRETAPRVEAHRARIQLSFIAKRDQAYIKNPFSWPGLEIGGSKGFAPILRHVLLETNADLSEIDEVKTL